MSAMAVAAKRYAKALFALAKEKGSVEETGAQFEAVAAALEGNADIRNFFDHPNIGADAKVRALKQAVGGQVSDYVLNTLMLLVERGRGAAIGEVSSAYRAIADESLGRAQARVTSAFALSAEQQQEIARKFGALTGKEVAVETVVDPSILGGIRVRIGDTLYDGSLSTKLAEIERSFNHAR
ncbi:F0F1 ATP synthase subunit delta [Paenibacillus antri]|uniref:ATP synthase subunit delta n=1 Tax=Paenibacillus antri TaxID=2582848 RepID=A0A5R9G8U7_9BACL|nr:F0F1 ATP synthase subunit delta [Paenibacillus antri]TLS50520.1 F0F1 ATP synthase subunit delta [Paenibacillus antri]